MDLFILNLAILLFLLERFLVPFSPLQVGLGLLTMFFIPGYALLAMVFPANSELDSAQRLGLSIVLSIAIVATLGTSMSFTPLGIEIESVLGSVALVVVLLTGVALFRRSHLQESELFAPRISLDFAKRLQNTETLEKASLGALLAVVIGVGAFAYLLMAPVSQGPFTDFYLLNAQGGTETYRIQRPIVEDVAFVIGIVNGEGSRQEYLLVTRFGGEEVARRGPIAVGDREVWEEAVVVPREMLASGVNQRRQLEFFLYQAPELEIPFSRVYTWVDPESG